MFATPVAYLIDGQGVIEKEVAVGADQIQARESDRVYGSTISTSGP